MKLSNMKKLSSPHSQIPPSLMIPPSIPFQQHSVYLHLRKNFQQTKTHLSIANLGNPLFIKTPHILSIFLQRTVKKLRVTPKKLKKLTLDLHYAQFQQSLFYEHLLKDLKHIEDLKLIFSPDSYLNVYFQVLLKTLKRLRNLKVFEIIVPISFEWQHEYYMKNLIEALSKSAAPKLRDLKLIFRDGNGSPLQLTGLPLLNGWGMKKLACLQNLTLHLTRSAFLTFPTENEGKFDISALKRLKKLKSLDLGIIDACIQRLPPLKKFTFNHPKGQLFPNLKSFKWTLLDTRWDELEGLQLLGPELVRSFRNPVEDFSVKIKQSGLIKDHEIQTWKQSLVSLKTDLNQLYISCNEGERTSKGSGSLISALSGPKLKRMHTLSLEFLDWKGISDKFMAKLGRAMSPELRYLKIRFEFNQANLPGVLGVLQQVFEEKLTDEGISKFGRNLAEKCENLEFVWLEFGKYEKITDRGVKSLCESLSQIESLKRVWLKFRFCFDVSGKYVNEILGDKREVKFALI